MNKQTSDPRKWFFVRFFLWLFSWRILRRVLITLAVIVTVAALVVTEENWRGKRDWENYKREQEAKGERFDLASFTPKPGPPEQNFYATPFLAPLLDFEVSHGEVHWRDSNGVARANSLSVLGEASVDLEKGDLKAAQKFLRSNTNFLSRPQPQEPAADVLFALEKFDPILTELRAASERPAAVYSSRPDRDLIAQFESFKVLKSMTRLALLHSIASLEAGHSADALADVRFMFRLGQALQGEPTLISHLVRMSLLSSAVQPVRQGLLRHRWSDVQLQELQSLFLSGDLLADYGQMMRGERAYSNELMAQYTAGNFDSLGGQHSSFKTLGFLSPRGLFYQNQLAINRAHEQTSLRAVDSSAHRVYPALCKTNALMASLGRQTPYNVLGRMLFPAIQKIALSFAHTQTKLDHVVIACALERHRLARGNFPETIEALVPQFLAKIPGDVISGESPKYRRNEDGSFLLYSVGWNEKDDGGTAALNKDGREIRESGDWVWR